LTLKKITGVIRKIHLYYYPGGGDLWGIRFFDADSALIYESAWKNAFTNSFYKKQEILLKEGERIIGFVSSGD